MQVRLHKIGEQSCRNCRELFGEHSSDMERMLDTLRTPGYNPEDPMTMLGIDWDLKDRTLESIQANYYVGAQWLIEGESAMMVLPKIKDLDFMTMFMKCYDSRISDLRTKMSSIYHVDLDADPIRCDSVDIDITPLLIAHFVKLAEGITKKGLKRDYVIREEALNGKIKGKLMLGKVMRRVINTGRQDILDCRYQDYSVDNIDNRILKKTLLFAQSYFLVHGLSSGYDILNLIRSTLSCFGEVNSDVSVQEIKHHRNNPLFKEYNEALKVAKMVLCRFGYSISNTSNDTDKRSTPPFWINMPILFELYAYSALVEKYGDQIGYHLSTYGNELDFVKYDERLIIDTKYIPAWDESINHENVRQLSGYARNRSLRRQIMKESYDETTILPCMVLYPGKDSTEGRLPCGNMIEGAARINSYISFYKRGFGLPHISDSSTNSDGFAAYSAQTDGDKTEKK